MVVRQETHPGTGAGAQPPEFRAAVASMHAAQLRPEIFCEEMPAPQRIAPFSAALSADVTVDGDEVGTGRIILLHDPAGNDAWDGTFRCVAYARAEIDLELITDPMLGAVGWSWLTEALDAHQARTPRPPAPSPASPPRASAAWPTNRHRAAGDPRLLDADRRPNLAATWRPGASCCARPSDCRRSPKESPRCPAGAVNAARVDDRSHELEQRRSGSVAPEAPEVVEVPLLKLRDGLGPIVDTEPALAQVCADLAAGTGPVAIDAERASGYRYSARAYLIQLRREGSGTALVDPVAFGSLEPLQVALGDTEWILHAASQDLPCLAAVGLRPAALFDTELAGRLLGYPRVGLATLVETILGQFMRKEHSAVDWSTRPLPNAWLEYAALDVEVLIELKDILEQELVDAGKDEWARQEFEHLLDHEAPIRHEPWRRTSGLHKVRGRRALAAVRSSGRNTTGSPASGTSPPGASCRTRDRGGGGGQPF